MANKETFVQQLNRFQADAKELVKSAKEISQAESLARKWSEAKDEILRQKDVIDNLRQENNSLQKSYAPVREAFAATNESLQAQKKALESTLRRTKQELDNIVHKTNIDKDILRDKIRKAEDKTKVLENELHSGKKVYNELYHEYELLRTQFGTEALDPDVMFNEFNHLSTELHTISQTYIAKPFSEETNLSDRFSQLHASHYSHSAKRAHVLIPTPLPISQSLASTALRAANFEMVVSDYLASRVFQLLPSVYSTNEPYLRWLLNTVLNQNGPEGGIHKEGILRAVLVSASTFLDLEKTNRDTAAKLVEDIMQECRPIIPDSNDERNLGDAIQTFIMRCLEVWNYAQRCAERIEVTTDRLKFPYGWYSRTLLGSLPNQNEEQQHEEDELSHPTAILFPKVYVARTDHMLYEGFAMWGNEELVTAGKQEYKHQEGLLKKRRDSVISKGRRNSIVGDAVRRFEARRENT